MKRLAVMLTMFAALLGARAASAQPAGKKLSIAIFAPNAPFPSGNDRFNFVQRLAQQITSAAGVPAEGKAFARAADLEAAIKAKQVDFAVIDGVYLAETGVRYGVMAIATTGGETSPKWALFSATVGSVQELQGKRLSRATAAAGRDDAFIENGIFDGELQVKKFFAGTSTAPDIVSAITAVSLKKADAVVAPESEGKGMKNIFEAGRIPNPAFCEVAAGLSNDLVAKVKQAVLSHGAAATLDGWKAGDAGPYRALAGRLGVRAKRPVMSEPEVVKMEDLDILVPPSLEFALPELKTQFWMP